jgi:hypothetical protein
LSYRLHQPKAKVPMTHLVHTREIEAVRKTRRRAKWAARKHRTVTRERDPIIAAIDRCRQADAAFVAASHRFDETGTVEADIAAKKAVAAFATARLTLARTVPTTPAGLAAIMGFVWTQTVEYGRIYFDDAELAAFIFSVASAAQALASVFERLV